MLVTRVMSMLARRTGAQARSRLGELTRRDTDHPRRAPGVVGLRQP